VANIAYQNDAIPEYFATNRIRWEQFYPSEREVIAALEPKVQSTVLDIGCGCGGLGLALFERFGVLNYTGVEINSRAARAAAQMNARATIHEGDILDVGPSALAGRQFDLVFSLSCVDWNVEFDSMFNTAWSRVAPGGSMVATFRLTLGPGCRDMQRSYQHINYEGNKTGEVAAYVVLNVADLMSRVLALRPARVHFVGYWRAPSPSAVTPYDRLCFVACSIVKCQFGEPVATHCTYDLPSEVKEAMQSQESGRALLDGEK
jgi:trans-aconitate methyltransferase